jgi:SPX domain protein involved in polyphosphate accumulation
MSLNHRYEIKYILDTVDLSNVLSWIYTKTNFTETYKSRVVNSLYLDDLDFSSAKDNLSGVVSRKKTRLRWYDNNTENNPLLEIKYRDGRLGYKKSYIIGELEDILFDINVYEIMEKIKNTVIFEQYMSPTLHVCYERRYFQNLDNIRITLDTNIKFYQPTLFSKLYSSVPYAYTYSIFEIKFGASNKYNVANIIRPTFITPKRHSKYLIGLASLGVAVYI